jgi:hypothetical protein
VSTGCKELSGAGGIVPALGTREKSVSHQIATPIITAAINSTIKQERRLGELAMRA